MRVFVAENLFHLFWAGVLLFFCATWVHPQGVTGREPPQHESFRKKEALASPWRDSGCHRNAVQFREPGCKLIQGEEWKSANVMALYSSDGSPWFRFELAASCTAECYGRQKVGFKPFAVPRSTGAVVLLRIVAESDSWLEVEVNEDTRETKFISKHDPMWSTTSYAYWILESERVRVGDGQSLREKPAGDVIKEYSSRALDEVVVKAIEGDWVLVEDQGSNEDMVQGWIRWKDGRNILVGCGLNRKIN